MPRHFHFGHRLDIFKTTSQLFQPYQVQHLRKKEVCVWVLSHMMFNNADFNGPSGKIKVWVPPQILSEYQNIHCRGMGKCKIIGIDHWHYMPFFFISINIFQPSLKLMLSLSRFQPQNMLMWCLKVKTAREFFIIWVWMI